MSYSMKDAWFYKSIGLALASVAVPVLLVLFLPLGIVWLIFLLSLPGLIKDTAKGAVELLGKKDSTPKDHLPFWLGIPLMLLALFGLPALAIWLALK